MDKGTCNIKTKGSVRKVIVWLIIFFICWEDLPKLRLT